MKPKATEPNTIQVPFMQHLLDATEEETYKLLGNLVMHNKGWGYTCFVSSFAIFISEKEIKVAKSQVIKAFNSINTIEKFTNLKLPIIEE